MKTNKVLAAVIAVAAVTATVSSMTPAFAYDESETLINSYANPVAQDIAEYCLDNGMSLEETKELVDGYASRNTVSAARSGTNDYLPSKYHNDTLLSESDHYIVLILTNTTERVTGKYQMYLTSAYAESNDTYSLCRGYDTASGVILSVNTSYGILTNLVAPAGVTTASEAAFAKYGLIKGESADSEKDIYDAIYSSDITSDANVAYDTYALGDVNHNGSVDSDDTDCLLEYIVQSREDLSFTYYDSNAGGGLHSAVTNWLAADANQDNAISLVDVTTIRKLDCYVELEE
ncbi:MAG: hypothetical protein J6A30_05200 [Ruminococcus sp.]|nr:hypothetical protein [Ruminococcus sp.]